jgi:hypothetical protein
MVFRKVAVDRSSGRMPVIVIEEFLVFQDLLSTTSMETTQFHVLKTSVNGPVQTSFNDRWIKLVGLSVAIVHRMLLIDSTTGFPRDRFDVGRMSMIPKLGELRPNRS